MFKRVFALAALSALAVGARPEAVMAQGVSLTPFVGYYAPLGDVLDEGGTTLATQGALTFGGRLTVGTPGPGAFEGALAYSSAGVESGGREEAGTLRVLRARALYRLGSLGPSGSLHAGAGLAYLKRGGDFWDAFEDLGVEGIDDFGGTLGLGAKFGLGSSMAIRVDLEDFIYSAKFNDADEESDSKLQNDLLLSAGLSFGF